MSNIRQVRQPHQPAQGRTADMAEARGFTPQSRQRLVGQTDRPVLVSGTPFAGDAWNPLPVDRSKNCTANDDTCQGWRMKGYTVCSGHAGLGPGRPKPEVQA